MMINDFSSLIQITATISAAFVAAESVRSYTSVACEKLLGFGNFVKNALDECRCLLVDEETLNHLEPVQMERGNTLNKIESAKRDRESLCKEISKIEEKSKNVTSICQVKSMSSLCFSIFLFNMILLFLGGFENVFPIFSHVLLIVFCSLFIIYHIIFWIIEYYHFFYSRIDYSSLKIPVIVWSVVVLISIICYCRIKELTNSFAEQYWWYVLVVGILFSYLNFVVFVVRTWNMMRVFKNDLKAEKDVLKKKCEEANTKASELLIVVKVNASLCAE